jgi:hypothetical protein
MRPLFRTIKVTTWDFCTVRRGVPDDRIDTMNRMLPASFLWGLLDVSEGQHTGLHRQLTELRLR